MDKLFTIQPDFHHEIFTGLNAAGLQMLATDGIGDVFIVVYFAADGTFLRFEEHAPLDFEYNTINSPLDDDARAHEALKAYLLKLGFARIQPIQVKKFFIPKHLIGIRQYPDSLQRLLKDGHEYSREELEALAARKRELKEKYPNKIYFFFSEDHLTGYSAQEEIDDADFFERWTERGDYVMWSQNDYWSSADGFIHSS